MQVPGKQASRGEYGGTSFIFPAGFTPLQGALQSRLSPFLFPPVSISSIVDAENTAFRKIAEQIISNEWEAITEGKSGLPAFKYVREIS